MSEASQGGGGGSGRSAIYYKEAILKKEGRSKWTEYYAVLTGCHLVFTKQDKKTGVAIPHDRTSLEVSRRTVCGYSRRTCYRFPFYIQTDRGTYYFKCETNLQRYRWIYAIRLASNGKAPEPAPNNIPMKSPRRMQNNNNNHNSAASRKATNAHNNNNNNNNNSNHNNNNNVAGEPRHRTTIVNGNAGDRLVSVSNGNNGVRGQAALRAAHNGGYMPDPSDRMDRRSRRAVPAVPPLSSHEDWQLHSCSSSESEDDGIEVEAEDRGQLRGSDKMANVVDRKQETIDSEPQPHVHEESTELSHQGLRRHHNKGSRRTSRSEEAIGSRIHVAGSAQHGLSQESVASGGRPARSFAMYAPTRYSDTMKSQSWTSVRSPINTTRRRESSAPSLRFSRYCEEITEVS